MQSILQIGLVKLFEFCEAENVIPLEIFITQFYRESLLTKRLFPLQGYKCHNYEFSEKINHGLIYNL
jgi:hypothetical protein